MSREDVKEAVFGGFDGLSVGLGLIAGLLLTGRHGAVLVAAVALAAGECVSMASGEWLSDPQRSFRRAAVMGAATLAGGLLPVLPFGLTGGTAALVGCLTVTGVLGAVIAEARPGARARSYLETFAVLTLAGVAAVAAALLTAAAG